jgi:16S rRNA processing protein RimM
MSDTNPAPPPNWTVLARLLRPQGRRGELLAELLTDFPNRFGERDQLYVAAAGFAGTSAEARRIEVTGHWLPVGRNQGRIVLALAGVNSIEAAEALAGLEVVVPSTARVELEEGEEYIDDLVGCLIFDLAGAHPDEPIGAVTAVEFPATADGARRLPEAAPLLTALTPEGDEILIPYVQSFLVSLSTSDKRIEMRLPAGLLELNRTPSS